MRRDTLGQSLAEFRTEPGTGCAVETASGRHRQAGARDAIRDPVSPHFGFVVRVANRYRHMGVPVEDLVNEGNIGPLMAASRIDPSRGTRFTACAA